MASPAVAATNTSAETAPVSSHTVALPASIASGDLLVAFFARDGGAAVTTTWPGGWTSFFDVSESGANLDIAYRWADGTEGSSITVTTSVADNTAHVTYRITDAEDPATQAPEISTGATGEATSGDPDTITPTGGSKDYLFLAVTAAEGGETVSAPAGYSNLQASAAGAGQDPGIGVAEKQATASSEDPGTMALSGYAAYISATLAIHPVGAAILAIGLATETDSAFPVTNLLTQHIGLATGADSAFSMTAVGGPVSKAIGLAAEADTAFAVTSLMALSIGLAAETDSAFPVTNLLTQHIGLASEADSAFSMEFVTRLTNKRGNTIWRDALPASATTDTVWSDAAPTTTWDETPLSTIYDDGSLDTVWRPFEGDVS